MKKLLTLSLFALLFTIGAQAQNTVRVDGGGSAYEKGDNILQLGLGLGRAINSYGFWSYGGLGASINAAVEIGIHEYFSVGPYAAVGRYSYNFIGEDFSTTAVAAGARGSFHYTPLLNEVLDINVDEEKIDLYVSILLGLEFFSTNYEGDRLSGSSTFFDGGALLGGRYKLNPRVGVYTELGYAGLSVWTLGVSFHL